MNEIAIKHRLDAIGEAIIAASDDATRVPCGKCGQDSIDLSFGDDGKSIIFECVAPRDIVTEDEKTCGWRWVVRPTRVNLLPSPTFSRHSGIRLPRKRTKK